MVKAQITKWTLVQHSGWSGGGKIGFKQAVEEAPVNLISLERRILAAGGLIFDNYKEASEAEYRENYPPGVEGMYPRAEGTFSQNISIDGRWLYIPKKEV